MELIGNLFLLDNQPMFAMSGDGRDDIKVPVVFLFTKEAVKLKESLLKNVDLEVNSFSIEFLQYLTDNFQ